MLILPPDGAKSDWSEAAKAADDEPLVTEPSEFEELISRLAPNQMSFDLSFVFMRSSSCDMKACVRLFTEWRSAPPRALQ